MVSGTDNRGIKQAPFRVLVGATMPAVLVEAAAFISNADEEKKLASPVFQQSVADGIAQALSGFFGRRKGAGMRPPAGTPGSGSRGDGSASARARADSMTRRAAAVLPAPGRGWGLSSSRWFELALWRGAPEPRFRSSCRVTPPRSAADAAGVPQTTPAETVRLTLFFPGQEDARLHAEERDIPKPAGPGASLRAIFGELQAGGPTVPAVSSPRSPKIQLRNAFLLPDGEAVLDLAVDAGLSFGSDEELTIVAALVDTTLQNVADTTRRLGIRSTASLPNSRRPRRPDAAAGVPANEVGATSRAGRNGWTPFRGRRETP